MTTPSTAGEWVSAAAPMATRPAATTHQYHAETPTPRWLFLLPADLVQDAGGLVGPEPSVHDRPLPFPACKYFPGGKVPWYLVRIDNLLVGHGVILACKADIIGL